MTGEAGALADAAASPGFELPGAAGGGAGVAGTSVGCVSAASSRSSAVGVQRHARSFSKLPVNPPVLTSVQKPEASTIAATSVAHRIPGER